MSGDFDIFGTVDQEGKFKPKDPNYFKLVFKAFRGKEIILNVKEWIEKRSTLQNRYYWGVVVAAIADYMGEDDHEAVHDLLKRKFNGRIAIGSNGEEEVIGRSTTKMNRLEFCEYIDRIQRWAVVFCGGLIIRSPDEKEIPKFKPKKNPTVEDIMGMIDY